MEINYRLSKKDFIKFAKLRIEDFLIRKPFPFIFLVLALVFLITGNTIQWPRLGIALATAPILAVILLYFVPLLIYILRINRLLSRDKSSLEQRKIIASDAGLLLESDSVKELWRWEKVVSVQANKKFIYLSVTKKAALLIPNTAFVKDSDATNFLTLVQTKIVRI